VKPPSRLPLSGFSVAGVETAIEVPSLGLVLDLGRCSRTAVNQPLVLVSHGHLDHLAAIVQHAARRAMMNMAEGVYVVPASIAAEVERMFAAAEALDGGRIPRRVVPLGRGEELDLGKRRRVRAFETFHRVPSQGYTVWERRHRLRPEFRGLDGARLGELRRAGQEIDEAHDVPVLCFSGDTRVEALERNPELQQAETLLLEATFLDDRVSVEDARQMGHIHLDELIARSELLAAREIVLHHFSARYSAAEAAQICLQRIPDAVKARLRVFGAEESDAKMR
jgi:ribonuclease Z